MFLGLLEEQKCFFAEQSIFCRRKKSFFVLLKTFFRKETCTFLNQAQKPFDDESHNAFWLEVVETMKDTSERHSGKGA